MSIHRFRIFGVDRATGFETELILEASTEANARAKAELRGVVVTDIEDLDRELEDVDTFDLHGHPLTEKELFTPAQPSNNQLTDEELIQEQIERLEYTPRKSRSQENRTTDPFAIAACSTGLLSLLIIPIVLKLTDLTPP